MRIKNIFSYIIPALLAGMFFPACNDTNNLDQDSPVLGEPFSFAFMTDLHLNFRDNGSFEGFQQAIAKADELGVDFIITGGDNVDADYVGDDEQTARKMYERFKEIIDKSGVDINVTIGNHDRFWHMEGSREIHGAGLFNEYFGDTWFDYDYNGVHFIHLNSSEVCEGQYCVSPAQEDWLKGVLEGIDGDKPVVVVAHVPFLSFYYPVVEGHYTDTDIFRNFREVWSMFDDHNLELVLQGHMHLYEDLYVYDTQFLTGGALSGNWWRGPFYRTPEGFILVEWDGSEFSWEYIDYGWEAW